MAIMGGFPEAIIVQPSVMGLGLPFLSFAIAITTCSGYLVLIACSYSTCFCIVVSYDEFFVYGRRITAKIVHKGLILARRNKWVR